MKDCAGRKIEVGMECVTTRHGYSDLVMCKVCGFTPKKIRILRTYKNGEEDEFLKYPNQIAIIKLASTD